MAPTRIPSAGQRSFPKSDEKVMRIKLSQKLTDHLIRLPESGMGYQRVDVRFADGSTQQDCVVLNAETIELPETCEGKVITDIRLHKTNHPTTESNATSD